MQSARANPGVIKEYLENEVGAGRVIGQIDQMVQVSRFGAIPKAEQNKGRLIVDLSYPTGREPNLT